TPEERSKDWAGTLWGYAFIWGIPTAIILLGFLAPVPVRGRAMDNRACLDGHCLPSERAPLRADALPVYRSILSCHDLAGSRAHVRDCSTRALRLARAGSDHSPWKQAHLVGNRTYLGKVYRSDDARELSIRIGAARRLFPGSAASTILMMPGR